MNDLLLDPAAITAESFRRIDALLAPYAVPASLYPLVRRVVHTTADFEWVASLRIHPEAISQAVAALRSGASIVTDVQMVAAGIQAKRLASFGGAIHCAIDAPEVAEIAAATGITRAMAAIHLLSAHYPHALYVVGNAPTALVAVIERCHAGVIAPPAIIGVPVGFVSTIESKTALMNNPHTPWISNIGPKGGSAVAAAVVNALIGMAGDV